MLPLCQIVRNPDEGAGTRDRARGRVEDLVITCFIGRGAGAAWSSMLLLFIVFQIYCSDQEIIYADILDAKQNISINSSHRENL